MTSRFVCCIFLACFLDNSVAMGRVSKSPATIQPAGGYPASNCPASWRVKQPDKNRLLTVHPVTIQLAGHYPGIWPVWQPASVPAVGQPASQPVRQPASGSVSHLASRPARQPPSSAGQLRHLGPVQCRHTSGSSLRIARLECLVKLPRPCQKLESSDRAHASCCFAGRAASHRTAIAIIINSYYH